MISDLRNLDENHCLLVTSLELMRGVDYHAPGGVGIDLLVATDFPSTRAYQQGLGRVGRYGEPCSRFKWEGLISNLVNELQEIELRGRIGNKVDGPKDK